MNCGCENTREIFPECDKTRWEVQCSSYIEDASNYYTKKQVDDLIESATTSGSCCITPEEVDEKIESAKTEIEAEIPSLSGYATEQWVLDKHYISGVDLSDYALKSEIPTVPTSNTAFTNDAGYLTEHQSLSAYSTTDEVNSAITQATSGLQPSLSAGTNITITTGNVISATDTKYTAGSGITITGTTNKITLDANIYKGAGILSISCNNIQGTSGGANNIKGQTSFGAGFDVQTNNNFEAAFGTSNNSVGNGNVFDGSSGKTLFSVGNGETNNKHNAFEIRQNGDIYISSGGTRQSPMIKLQDHLGGGGGTGTTYTAGDGISISNQNVISTITKFWCGDEAAYNQITTKDPNTVYMIHS